MNFAAQPADLSEVLTEAHWEEAQNRGVHNGRVAAVVGVISLGLVTVPAVIVALAVVTGAWRYAVAALGAMVLGAPLVAVMVTVGERQQARIYASLRDMSRKLNAAVATAEQQIAARDAQASRQQFESRLSNALDMADGENEVLNVIERSLATVVPGAPAELLLADNSQAHLIRTASVGMDAEHRGCSVDSPAHCPAARRAQMQIFDDSNHLDACPKLRGRSAEPFSAVCVPVSIMGRTVGVIHTTHEPPAPPADEQTADLATLAKLAGARLGMIRAMADSQLQAATDSLTGLLNRRSFEQKVAEARRAHSNVTLAMGDLDGFKTLNDTYGHETGDRALRLFARVLRESLRGADILCRYGGEEFSLALPSCSARDAVRALDSVRSRLDAAITVSGLPAFTVSFGVAQLQSEEDLTAGLTRADAALFSAKKQGRDRVVVDQGLPKKGRPTLRTRDIDEEGEIPEDEAPTVILFDPESFVDAPEED